VTCSMVVGCRQMLIDVSPSICIDLKISSPGLRSA